MSIRMFRLRGATGLLLLAALAGFALLVGCSGGSSDDHASADHDDDQAAGEATVSLEDAPKDRVIEISMTEFDFGESTIEIEAGQIIELAFTNDGLILHDFTIEQIHADVHVTNISGAGHHEHLDADSAPPSAVHIALDPGGEGLVHLKAEEAGQYVFYCSVPGHREGGMVGTLTVLAGDGQVASEAGENDGDGA